MYIYQKKTGCYVGVSMCKKWKAFLPSDTLIPEGNCQGSPANAAISIYIKPCGTMNISLHRANMEFPDISTEKTVHFHSRMFRRMAKSSCIPPAFESVLPYASWPGACHQTPATCLSRLKLSFARNLQHPFSMIQLRTVLCSCSASGSCSRSEHCAEIQ